MKAKLNTPTSLEARQAHFDEWKRLALEDIAALATTGSAVRRPKHSAYARAVVKYVYGPICCAPCFLWSCFVRVACCPITCGHSVGGNMFTEQSDGCISRFYASADTSIVPDRLVEHDMSWVSRDHSLQGELLNVIEEFFKHIQVSLYKFRMILWIEKQFIALGYRGFDFSRVLPADIYSVAIGIITGKVPSQPPSPPGPVTDTKHT